MKRIILIILLVITFLALILFIRGCGNSIPSHTYKIARDPTLYPLNVMGKERNILAFFDDLILEIALKEKFQVALLSMGPNSLESSVERGEYDAMLSSLQPTSLRKERLLFSDPIFYTGPVLIVPEHSKAKSIADMKGKRVGIQTNSVIIFNILDYPAVVTPFQSRTAALEALAKGDLDGLVMELVAAYSYTESLYLGVLKVIGEPLTDDALRLVGNRSTAVKLIEHFNEGLKDLMMDGQYEGLLLRWGLDNPKPQTVPEVNVPEPA
jgi:polar amino acid transport system substrate-binding protein